MSTQKPFQTGIQRIRLLNEGTSENNQISPDRFHSHRHLTDGGVESRVRLAVLDVPMTRGVPRWHFGSLRI